MDQPLKQRLIGAAVLAALAVIFLPMLLKGPDVRELDAAEVPLSMPATPGQDFETRELPLTTPEQAPPGGVLGMQGRAQSPGPGGAAVVPDGAVAPIEPPVAGDTAVASTGPATGPAAKPPSAIASPVAPVAPGSESAATGGGDFVVNLGTFANRANADALVAKLRGAGLPVLEETVKLAAGDGTRVRVGPYSDRTAAEAGRLRAQGSTSVAGSVVVLDAAPTTTAAPKPPKSPTPTATAAPKPPASATTAAPATPTASAPTAPASAPATSLSGFAVQLSAPAAESDALALRDKARAAGLSSFVQRVETPNGVRYRVRVGPYADRASAESALGPVNAKLGTHGIVMRNP